MQAFRWLWPLPNQLPSELRRAPGTAADVQEVYQRRPRLLVPL